MKKTRNNKYTCENITNQITYSCKIVVQVDTFWFFQLKNSGLKSPISHSNYAISQKKKKKILNFTTLFISSIIRQVSLSKTEKEKRKKKIKTSLTKVVSHTKDRLLQSQYPIRFSCGESSPTRNLILSR